MMSLHVSDLSKVLCRCKNDQDFQRIPTPSLHQDDTLKADSFKLVIPTQAGIQRRSYARTAIPQGSTLLGLCHQLLPNHLQFTLARINHRLIVKRGVRRSARNTQLLER